MNSIAFDAPAYLFLLLLLPVLWFMSFRSLAGLGPIRRLVALTLRSVVFTILVLCLARMQWQGTTDKLTVIYVLDQSESIPKAKREYMLQYVHNAVKKQRRSDKGDKAGVVIFGGNAKIEAAPFDGELPIIDRFEAGFDLDTGSTSLESALKLAKATFPEDSAKRVVIVSDGNENIGNAVPLAQSMADEGIGIDVVPVELDSDSEVSVEKVVLPSDVRRGEDFEARIVLNNDTQPTDANPDGNVEGTLKLVETAGGKDTVVESIEVTLEPGKNIFPIKHQIDRAAVFTYEATFTPKDPSLDSIQQNNTASAFTHVRGKGKVLLIEDAQSLGEFDYLVQKLTENSIEVQKMPSDALFSSAAELLEYDSVILANVPRATGEDLETSSSFSDEQIQMLVRNCEDLGCGLVVIGGDRSFGAGGWSNTGLEKAMPVDFQIKNDKVDAVGCLIMMMHASEIAQSNFWQKKICQEAIKILGPMDYCGVVTWANMGTGSWLWRLPTGVDRVFGNRKKMMGMVGRMTVGDMPDFNGPMKLALKGFKTAGGPNAKPSMKHMIIISDGDPVPPSNALLNQFVAEKVVISTVACGVHAQANNPLKKIARVTGGKFYFVKDARALPKIFQREARRVAKPVIKESRVGMGLRITQQGEQHEILKGVDLDSLPPILGYVMTTTKTNPLVEQLLLSAEPKDEGENSTLLATWRYGVGRATAFTSDAGQKWTTDWLNNPNYEKLFVQAIRHSMRPITESANFTVATEVKDNKARIVVTALDENDEFLNFLKIGGTGVSPGIESFNLQFNQVGPGRYIAEKEVNESGNYLFSVMPGEGYERLTAGINVPYSTEYSDRAANLALLENLSGFETQGGDEGQLISGQLNNAGLDELLSVNTFRPTLSHAFSIENAWPWLLVLCGSVFLVDIFVRRVAIDLAPVWALAAATRARLRGEDQTERQSNIARLQSRKAEIEKSIETRRAATRFEPDIDESKLSGQQRLDEVIGDEIRRTPERREKIVRDTEADKEETSYTSRLLDAKRKAQQKRDRDES